MARRRSEPEDIEVVIGPHPARPDWRVLRVSYAAHVEHDGRVVAALAALFSPPQHPTARAGSRGDVDG